MQIQTMRHESIVPATMYAAIRARTLIGSSRPGRAETARTCRSVGGIRAASPRLALGGGARTRAVSQTAPSPRIQISRSCGPLSFALPLLVFAQIQRRRRRVLTRLRVTALCRAMPHRLDCDEHRLGVLGYVRERDRDAAFWLEA